MNAFSVLMYHEIIKREDFIYQNYKGIKVKQGYKDILPPVLFAYLDRFEEQMEYLYNEGYVCLSLKDVVDYYYNGKALPNKSVLLTFDDLYKSVLLYAYPILKKYGLHAVGFVVKDWIFDEKQEYSTEESVCLSKVELDQMRDVFEYANHTSTLHTRNEGRGALERIDKNSFLKDLRECEAFIDSPSAFAYPFGIYNNKNIKWLKEAGVLLAFTSENGKNEAFTCPFELHRNGVLLDFDLDKFKTIL